MTLTAPVVALALTDALTGTSWPLSLADGSKTLSLDDSQAPHVRGTVTVASPGTWELDGFGIPEFTPDTAAETALDARKPVRITTTITVGGTVRVFDLGLREVEPDYDAGTYTLTLASDEALLDEWGPLDDDLGARGNQASLRAVCSYVLARATGNLISSPHPTPGEIFGGFGNFDTITSSGVVTPSVFTNAGGVGSASSPYSIRVTLSSGAPTSWGVVREVAATPGVLYSSRVEIRSPNTGKEVQFWMQFLDGGGAALSTATTPNTPTVSGVWETFRLSRVAPVGTARVRLYARYANFTGGTGSVLDVTGMTIGKGTQAPAVLEPGTPDTDITAYWRATNYILNPGVPNAAGNWTGVNASVVRSAGAGQGSGLGYIVATGSATAFQVWPQATADATSAPRRVSRGDSSFVAAWVKQPSGSTLAAIRITYRKADGGLIGDYDGPWTALTTSWQKLEMMHTAPPGADLITAYLRFDAPASGAVAHVDNFLLSDSEFYTDTFMGSDPGAGYSGSWSGQTNASPSSREPIIDRPMESLTWRAGQSGLDFLHGHVQAAGLRLVCDELRRWTLRDENYTAAGSVTVTAGDNLIDGSERISRDSGEWFDAAVTRYRYRNYRGEDVERVDAAAPVTPYTRMREFLKDTPYPGPGFSSYAIRRAQARGRIATVDIYPTWTEAAEQPYTLTPPAPRGILTGKVSRVQYDLETATATLTSRAPEV